MDLEIIVGEMAMNARKLSRIPPALAVAPLALPLAGVSHLCDYFSEKIPFGDIQYMERVKMEEAQKLGLNPELIYLALTDEKKGRGTAIIENGDGSYTLRTQTQGTTRSDLRHELYHLYKGHFRLPKIPIIKDLIYYFWAEPQAVGYEVRCLLQDKFPRLRKN